MADQNEETKTGRGSRSASTAKGPAAKKANGARSRTNGQAREAAKPASRKAPARRSRRADFTKNLPSAMTLGQIALGAAAVVGAAVVAWQRYRESIAESDDGSPSAFHRDEAFEDNFDQTRAAGPAAMRDRPGQDWDEVDQQVDESFPASDPSGSYAGPPR